MRNQEPSTKNQEQATTNLAFYKFTPLSDPDELRNQLDELCQSLELKGTILLAHEGINGMLAGAPTACDQFEQAARALEGLGELWFKRSESDEQPFGKLVVKVKPEIVTMRVDGVDACSTTAEHLPAETFRDWLRSGEEMVVIDTRNDYEYQLGSFKGAINPNTGAFHEFPDYVKNHRDELASKKVVMFCTGGIRCEKATSWMLEEGFDKLYQLDGGVLNYFEKVKDADKDWDGELFVFDQRVAVDTRLEETETVLCEECGAPVKGGVAPVCSCAA
jgi:UPF0176 protein